VAAAAVVRRRHGRKAAAAAAAAAAAPPPVVMREMPRLVMAESGRVEHIEKFSHYVGQSPFLSLSFFLLLLPLLPWNSVIFPVLFVFDLYLFFFKLIEPNQNGIEACF
jgi:hypothetical protein